VKPKPLILITPDTQRKGAEFGDMSCSLSDRYPRAVIAAGGVPWVLPCLPDDNVVAEAVRRCDGVMLTGGEDVQPGLYAKDLPPNLQKTVRPAEPARDLLELMVIREVFRRRKPLLAICRGQQLLNVAFAGDLIVDIPTQAPGALNHNRVDAKDQVVHKAALTPDSILTMIAKNQTLGINSSHHQAVGRVPAPLRITAVSPDGIVEALELADGETDRLPYLLAVQFHPERLFDRHPEHLELFRSFTRACKIKPDRLSV
jgi:putative glutamine amidotransferase